MICPDRLKLIKSVMHHARLYDGVGGIIPYQDENRADIIDVLALRNNDKTATLYAVACNCDPELASKEGASERLKSQKRFLENNCFDVERINMVYVTNDHAYRIR